MSNNNITVDEFVKTKILPKYQPIAQEIRKLMQECAPHSKEIMSYGIPNFRGNKMLGVISPTKKGITFAFSRGAKFEDKYNLLEGVGKVSKNIRMSSIQDVNKDALRYYINQAIRFDEK